MKYTFPSLIFVLIQIGNYIDARKNTGGEGVGITSDTSQKDDDSHYDPYERN